ncbi:hypothetical protein EV126DRAFT_437096 [Verticillium dahliae]|nr:hypothetical protein EV126DRAFT_437096 [Verticillium dahliae]
MKQDFLLDGLDVEDFAYTRNGHDTITGVSDRAEWESLIEAFDVMNFSDKDQSAILRTIAAILHLGNISVVKESRAADQARLAPDAKEQAAKVCKLLGVPLEPFLKGLLHPRVKAGREWVEKVQTPDQVRLSLDALAKGIYERGFGDLVTRINQQLDRTGMGLDDSHFIGVLDIAGFEIFDDNSFEQLCINYTNEKLQQFFNHHMFVLEQEEYAREQIEWQFIDFGRDLQPTIDLIEVSNPIGIFSCLDEDCKSNKYRSSRLGQGFVLTHYAAEVEYSTQGWLEKNKDPLNDNITRLLSESTDKHVANLFADCADTDNDATGGRSRVKRGLFRTVAQRHKEQLHNLMTQLHSTHPHFVRCILPNHKKKPKQFNGPLVLDQLRCNGVLEGIRIARTGFPNRLPFAEFRQRYEVLCRDMPHGYLEGQAAAALMLDKLSLDKTLYRQRDALITDIMARFQSVARGYIQRRIAFKRLFRTDATRIVQRNFHVYLDLVDSPWWQLLVKMKPLSGQLGAPLRREDEKKRPYRDASSRAGCLAHCSRLEDEKAHLSKRTIELEASIEETSHKQSERSEQKQPWKMKSRCCKVSSHSRIGKLGTWRANCSRLTRTWASSLCRRRRTCNQPNPKESQLLHENRNIQQQLSQLSKTSTDYEDLVRKKESELTFIRSENKKYELERRSFEAQKKAMAADQEKISSRLHDVQAEITAMKTQKLQLEREAEDAKKLLEARLSEDAQADENRQYNALKEEFDGLNESKIIIEKSSMFNKIRLRRTMEAHASGGGTYPGRGGWRASRVARAREREESLRGDLTAAQERLTWFEEECAKLNHQNDQAKERLERELTTVRSRLTASENDNRALLNKLQQKVLKSHAPRQGPATLPWAGSFFLQREKARIEEQNDLNHEFARETKQSRNAEKATSTSAAQLAEVNRALDSENSSVAKLKARVRTRNRLCDSREKELEELRTQMLQSSRPWSPMPCLPCRMTALKTGILRETLTLSARWRICSKIFAYRLQQGPMRNRKLADLRAARSESPMRPKLEEILLMRLPSPVRPTQRRSKATPRKISNTSTSHSLRSRSSKTSYSWLICRTVIFRAKWTAAPPVPETYSDESPSMRRMQKLEQANSRLHGMLDDSTAKVSALEKSIRSGELSLRDIQTRSHEEILDVLNSQEDSRRSLLHSHKNAVSELTEVKTYLRRCVTSEPALKSNYATPTSCWKSSLIFRFALIPRLRSWQIYRQASTSTRGRSDEYFSKLEQAEIAVLKASRAEQFAKARLERQKRHARKRWRNARRWIGIIEDLQRQSQRLEEKVEDVSTDLDAAMQAKKRLQHELEDYRNQRANEIEDKESSLEQTRKKYQAEFATLTKELDLAREEKLFKQAEITRLREELDDLRSKWDDEVLNSSTWSKEKARLESTLADVVSSRDEAVNAHGEAQSKVWGDSPSLRDAANADKEILDLKSSLAQKEDITAAAIEKMRRAESLAAEMQKEAMVERETSAQLLKAKAALEKSLNEVQIKVVDLETKGYSSASNDIKFLHKRIQELESQLEDQETERSKSQRSVRNVDRIVQGLAKPDRPARTSKTRNCQTMFRGCVTRSTSCCRPLRSCSPAESAIELRLAGRNASFREEKERALRLEREAEGLRSMRMEMGSVMGGSMRTRAPPNMWRTGFGIDDDRNSMIDVPKRKSSISRAPSLTKGSCRKMRGGERST